jgi:hypothetical protein
LKPYLLFQNNQRKESNMTIQDLQSYAPAALSIDPRPGLSSKYSFLPTKAVIDALGEDGWIPVDCKQTWSRRGGCFNPYSKHQIWLADRDIATKGYSWAQEMPRIILTNSHNGQAAYRMRAGLFRKACSNGIEVSDGLVQAVSIPHTRHSIEEVVATAHAFRENAELVGEHVRTFKGIDLSPAAAVEFARRAIELRHAGSEGVVAIEDILKPQRPEDAGKSLWRRFNVAQEWLLKGGYPVYHRVKHDWSIRDARPIRSIDESSKLNTTLWALAEQFSNN